MQWHLEAITDADSRWLVDIKSFPMVIGRADDCDLKLTDALISRHHSEIRISSDMLWIRDLDSTNGTYVNRNKVEKAQLLAPEDTITIGKHKFKVKTNASSAATVGQETIQVTTSKDLINFDLAAVDLKMRQLIRHRHVIPHFQPLLRFSDAVEVGYEILGRIHADGLPSNPTELLELAKCLDCAAELSSLFREVGVAMGEHIPGTPLLFVNSCDFEINDTDHLLASMQRIRDIAPSGRIVLEINEKAAAETNNLVLIRDALKGMDMGLAFDDFGVGQTRLVELSNAPPDYLKFDISLIQKIHLAPKRLHQMVSTFIKASHDLGILTIAEGIECAEEARVCRDLGFDLGQGYFLGRPAAIDQLEVNLDVDVPGVVPAYLN
jgi:EAL domain-containing protein (putative c-di-GMP-specific phosphodiesterase class I)